MNSLFSNCSSLSKLPDISIWETNNLIYMDNIFYNCSIILLPDISKWNIKNFKNIKHIFNSSLENSSDNIKNNSEFQKLSTDQISDFSSDENQRIIIPKEINNYDFNPESNKLNEYYDNFYN